MNEQYAFINSIHSIDQVNFLKFKEKFQIKHYVKGDHIVKPGQVQHEIMLVTQGVQMYCFNSDGKRNILGFSYPPNFCAVPESFFFQKPSKYYVTCLTDSEFEVLRYDELQLIFDDSQQIERLFRKLAETVGVGLINRQIELRSTTIEERFKAFCNRSPHLLQLVPHKYIASYLAIDPTNFSKLFNQVKF